MCQKLLSDASLFVTLLRCDEELAAKCREGGCPYCGGVLHSAKYPRKPRGALVALGDEYGYRLSFCCSVPGCRGRATPPSVRFLGRRVYLGAVVVLISALIHGANAKRVARLRELIGVDRRTLERWRVWWLAEFPRHAWYQKVRGELAAPVDETRLPQSLLECFGGDAPSRLLAVLRAIAPVTTSSVVVWSSAN